MGDGVRGRPAAPRRKGLDAFLSGSAVGQVLFQGFDDRVDDLAVRAVTALHVDMSLLVGRAPLFRETLQRGLRIALTKLCSSVPPGGAVGEDVDRCIEPDCDR